MTLINVKTIRLTDLKKFKNIFSDLSIFSDPQWINTVLKTDSITFGNRAFYLIAESKGDTIAIMPVCYRKILSKKILLMPYLTPYFDISFNIKARKQYKINSIKKQVLSIFLDFLINNKFIFGFFSINHLFDDLQPAIWKGITVYPRYTYIHKKNELISKNISSDLKNDLRFAEKNNLSIEESDNINKFIDIWKDTLKRQGVSRIYDDVLIALFKNFNTNKKIRLFLSHDNSNNIHSGCLIAYDKYCSYYIAGADKRDIRGSGSLGIVYAIEEAKKMELDFDFEGSMIEGIEKYFRKFGGELTPYFNMSSLSFQALLKIKKILSL